MRRVLAAFTLLVTFVLPALAGDYVPDRRLVVSKNVDFYGSDLQALFDTDMTSCRKACLSDPRCKAFTFNSRSNSCFPKSDISERKPYEGATSAEVLSLDPRLARVAPVRGEELDLILSDRDMAAALAQARGIGVRHPGGQHTTEALLKAAEERRAQKDYLNAMRWTGAAVAVTDRSDQWVEYGRLALLIKTSKSSDKSKYASRAMSASVNGYLRALNDPARVNALSVMADAQERLKRGRDMIPVLRLAEQIQPREELTARLDKAIAKYGFRIVEHEVESDRADPRVCAQFSERLVKQGVDYASYVKLPDQRMSVEAEGKRICIGGASHGERYTVTFREGLPAQSGEKLIKDIELRFYVRDRSPSVNFAGRAYVLPRTAEAAIPVQTVNMTELDLTLRRVSDRNILRAIQDDYLGNRITYWQSRKIDSEIGETVWTGKGEVQSELNRDMTTRLPVGGIIKDLEPGVYALTATVPGVDEYDSEGATQWFVLTDLGVTTMSGADGLHVFVRGLSDAQARAGVTATLVSRSNRVLGTATTDAQGYAHFEAGLTRGLKGAEPGLVTLEKGDDFAFLSLVDPAFDLSDRGVEGRAPAGPIDVFLATDRGAYRAGEVIHATVLARDGVAAAVENLPLTAILTRPDGVEYARHLSARGVAGGHVFDLPVGSTVPRGTWRLDIKADVDQPALASTTVLVEDFVPERIDFDLAMLQDRLHPGETADMTVTAKYLFGAPAGDLPVEGDTILRAKRSVEGWKGFLFGRYDATAAPRRGYFDGGRTGANGVAIVPVTLPEASVNDRPLEVEVIARVSEGSGRPVERRMTQAVAPANPVIGIKPLFEDEVEEGGEARFQLIALGADLSPTEMPVKWTLNRVDRHYQWYKEYGDWRWEVITTRKAVASGETVLNGSAVEVGGTVDWGRYELSVERQTDGDYLASSVDFYAGWYVPADTAKTPDVLDLSLDARGYRSGDVAKLRIVPRYAGTALVTVMSNRLIAMKAVEVEKGENLIDLAVTDDWGAGAYVTASVIRPMDEAAGQNPARSMGLSYAKTDPGAKQLSVTLEAPEQAQPRRPLEAAVKVEGVAPGETAYVTVAAVDLGILNMTGFESPDPSAHYFGQRRLGMDIRDVYGRLIDGLNGNLGAVRSGGDAGAPEGRASPPPNEDLVTFFSGPVEVGADGRAHVSFDVPEFNGTLRLMAVAWSKGAVGQADKEIVLRDPVVVTASVPRYLSPGDRSRLLLEIVHAEGPTGRMGLDVSAEGVSLAGDVPSGLSLGEKEKAVISVPVVAGEVGDHSIRIALTTPDGKLLTKSLVMPVRMNDPEVATTQRFNLAKGGTFTLDDNVFAEMRDGTGSAIVSAGPLAKLDAPGLLSALDRYPYGCTEQVTSVAMPLLYFGPVAKALGLGAHKKVAERVDQAIEKVLSRQASNGSFGLWYPASGDLWLDAYVSDFLSRARAEGHEVPQLGFRLAMDNLRNRVNYAADFDKGGQDIAYALMVLAREGAAAMADLRYYADEKAEAFTTPLGAAQIGAALAMYGDQTRADRMFARAGRMIAAQKPMEKAVWRADYGTNLRDAAGVLTLAVEAGSNAVDRNALAARVGAARGRLSTQESVWTLLAARALVEDPSIAGLTLNGAPVEGPLVKLYERDTLGEGVAIRNEGGRDTDVTLTTFGVPRVPPEAGGYGYRIDRFYYTMEGQQVETLAPKVGDRFVVVLRVDPFEKGEARLMIDDPLPAGFEIDNPNLLRSGDIGALSWLKPQTAEHAEFRADRFLAQVDWRSDKAFQLAYIVRAVSPGEFHHPAAQVEDMYRPNYRAQTATGRFSIAE